MQEFKMKLLEKDKRYEALEMHRHDELQNALSLKDQEITKL